MEVQELADEFRKVSLLVVPRSGPARLHVLKSENTNLAMLCLKAAKPRATPAQEEAYNKRLVGARAYLAWLYTTTDISSSDVLKSGLKNVLAKCVTSAEHLPEDINARAADLKESFENTTVVDDEPQDNANQDGGDSDDDELAGASQTVAGTDVAEFNLPPVNHPIFGRNGIMHGVITGRGKNNRIVRRLNPILPKKKATIFGHNDIPVGSWWPLQLVALFNGAHGSAMGGICGDTQLGAYSIVIANTYDDLDTDDGEVVFYSGSNSHKNTNPRKPEDSSQGTQALKASLRRGTAVRVLRSGGSTKVKNRAGNKYLPEAGIRYDGLYRVVSMTTPKNKKGMYIPLLYFLRFW